MKYQGNPGGVDDDHIGNQGLKKNIHERFITSVDL
jgi:hypothetical protein